MLWSAVKDSNNNHKSWHESEWSRTLCNAKHLSSDTYAAFVQYFLHTRQGYHMPASMSEGGKNRFRSQLLNTETLTIAILYPFPTSPTMLSAGTTTSSIDIGTVEEARIPSLSSRGPITKPGVS